MDWITDIIKHMTVSRTVTGAAFITSAVLLFGHQLYPTYIESVPEGWSWAVLTMFVFTSCLIGTWAGQGCYKFVFSIISKVKNSRPLAAIDENEKNLLYLLAKSANRPLNLEELFHSSRGQVSKLNLLHVADQLAQKGYVTKNPFEENLVSLTKRGRVNALEVEIEIDREKEGRER